MIIESRRVFLQLRSKIYSKSHSSIVKILTFLFALSLEMYLIIKDAEPSVCDIINVTLNRYL